MNDPHVKTLYYGVAFSEGVDYDNAPPLHAITDQFELSLDGKTAVFEMIQHFSSAEEARAVVDQYIRGWDILIGLEQGPGELRLVFNHAEIIDRSPDPPSRNADNLQVHVSDRVVLSCNVSLRVSRTRYPSFPSNFCASPDTEMMYVRYVAYCQNREPLASMAYVCLTVVEKSAGGRVAAAKQYRVDSLVLSRLGDLVSNKGTPAEARKAPKDRIYEPFNPKEKEWIVSVIKALIHRVGEYAYDPTAELKLLSMKDFPEL